MMAEQNQPADGKGPNRRLGRGLSSLLSVPVEIPAKPRSSSSLGHATPGPPSTPPAHESRGGMGGASELVATTTPTATATLAEERRARSSANGEIGDHSERAMLLPVDAIRPNTRQPRRDFDEASLASLADSIRRVGLMQPIVVRPIDAAADDEVHGAITHELIAGERRWRAAQQLGLASIPAIVRPMSDQASAEAALIENVQREDLNPIERCDGLRRLVDEFGLTHQELAERVGLDRSSVTNLLRLADLDAFTKDAVRSGRLGQGHAKALLAVDDASSRRSLAAATIAGDWSVRELERRVRERAAAVHTDPASAVPAPTAPSAHVADLERRLGEHLGSRVRIQLGRKKGTGRVVLEFFSLDQFDGLLARLGFDGSD